MKKWIKQPAAFLVVLLAISSLLVAGTGVALKHGSSSPLVQDTLAVAVPFLYLRGEVVEETVPEKNQDEAPLWQAEQGDDSGDVDLSAAVKTWIENTMLETQEASEQTQPARCFVPVEESYFNTALFIGDSRTEGLRLYGRLGDADYFADVGMSVFNLFDKQVSDTGYASQSLRSLLGSRQYETIYLSLGINEMGYPQASLQTRYAEVVTELRTLQPEANLILLGNLSVTRDKAAASSSLKLENIQMVNALIASFADEEKIFYLDPNCYFSDAEGYLLPEVTGDGVHPYAADYGRWAEWLMGYGIEAK